MLFSKSIQLDTKDTFYLFRIQTLITSTVTYAIYCQEQYSVSERPINAQCFHHYIAIKPSADTLLKMLTVASALAKVADSLDVPEECFNELEPITRATGCSRVQLRKGDVSRYTKQVNLYKTIYFTSGQVTWSG